MASALLALPASPRTKAEASERKMPCPFLHCCAGALGNDLSPYSARRLTPTHREAARQESNDDFWNGPNMSHYLPSPSAVLALQAPRNYCGPPLPFQARGREGVPPGYSQASEMGPQSSHYAQECYLWCRPCRLICAFLQLHLASLAGLPA